MGILSWLFSNDIKQKRINSLKKVRNILLNSVRELQKNANTGQERMYYSAMEKSIKETPVYFIPGKALQVQKYANGASAIMGQNVVSVSTEQKGRETKIKAKNYIVLPAGHLFSGDKLSKQGLLTLVHEYGHLQGRANEHIADALMLNMGLHLFKKYGFPKESIAKHFRGRAGVLGNIYPLYIRKIQKTERKPVARKPIARFRKPLRKRSA